MEYTDLLNEIKSLHSKMQDEVKASHGVMSAEVKEKLAKMETDQAALIARVTAMEQKAVLPVPAESKPEVKSLGMQFVESEGFKAVQSGTARSARVELKAVTTTQGFEIVSTGPKPNGIYPYGRVRSLIPVIPTVADLVKAMKETAFSNAAAPKAYGAAGSETTATLTPTDYPVRTINHFLNIAKEMVNDSNALATYLDVRMSNGLAEAEEAQILLADGTGSKLSGIVPVASTLAYTALDTKLDTLGKAIGKAMESGHAVTGIVLNPADYVAIMLSKVDGSYVMGAPGAAWSGTIWGVPAIPSPKMTANNYLVGGFASGAVLYDRQKPAITLSFENATNFTSGIVTVLGEQREALVVECPSAFVTGLFS